MFSTLHKIIFFLMNLVFVQDALGQRQFNYTLSLAPEYELTTEVDLDRNQIEFEAIVETTGWIGMGVSRAPNMIGSDLFMGWLRDGGSFESNDLWGNGTENGRPIPDNAVVSDWKIISGSQTENKTTIRFYRLLNVTDTDHPEQDMEIKDENIYLIWAYGELNRTVEPYVANYHTADARGSKRINLLKPEEKSTAPIHTSSLYFSSVLLALSIIITRF